MKFNIFILVVLYFTIQVVAYFNILIAIHLIGLSIVITIANLIDSRTEIQKAIDAQTKRNVSIDLEYNALKSNIEAISSLLEKTKDETTTKFNNNKTSIMDLTSAVTDLVRNYTNMGKHLKNTRDEINTVKIVVQKHDRQLRM
jgi:ribosomal protein S17E